MQQQQHLNVKYCQAFPFRHEMGCGVPFPSTKKVSSAVFVEKFFSQLFINHNTHDKFEQTSVLNKQVTSLVY